MWYASPFLLFVIKGVEGLQMQFCHDAEGQSHSGGKGRQRAFFTNFCGVINQLQQLVPILSLQFGGKIAVEFICLLLEFLKLRGFI